MAETRPQDRIFLNAYFDGFIGLRSLSRDFGGKVHAVKLGMGFLKSDRAAGIAKMLKVQGVRTFLDTKFHEDEDQMRYVIREYEGSHDEPDYTYVSVTAAADKEALKAARMSARKMNIVASLSSSKSKFFGLEVDNLLEANTELEQPIDFVMCNSHDIERVRSLGDFSVIATGIRLPGQSADDHPAVMGPGEAYAAGASYLSIGRAVDEAADTLRISRVEALDLVIKDMYQVSLESNCS